MPSIQLNGAARELPAGRRVGELLADLGLDPARVAVEKNGAIVPRADFPRAEIADGDRLEIVQFVGGG